MTTHITKEEPKVHEGRTWRVCTWNDQHVGAYCQWGHSGSDIQSMISYKGTDYEAIVLVGFGADKLHTLKIGCASLDAGIQLAGDIINRIESCRSNWTQKLPELQEIESMLNDEKSRQSKADAQIRELRVELDKLTKHQQSASKRVVFLEAAINEALGLSPASLAPSPTPLASAAE